MSFIDYSLGNVKLDYYDVSIIYKFLWEIYRYFNDWRDYI